MARIRQAHQLIAAAALALLPVAVQARTGYPPPQPEPTAAPSAAPSSGSDDSNLSPDQKVTKRALEWVERIQKGDIDRSQLTKDLNADFTPAIVENYKQKYGSLGAVQSIYLNSKQVSDGLNIYIFSVNFAQGPLNYQFATDSTGKIAALYFRS
jgi:hypothetical protein